MEPFEGDDGARVPADLVLVVLLAVGVVVASLVPALESSPARYVLAVVVVFLPGYALVAALFPRGPLAAEGKPGRPGERARRLDAFERAVLSVAAGLVGTPLVGILVEFSPWPFRETPVLTALAVFVTLAAAVAALRRRRVLAGERYVPARRWARTVRDVRHGRPTATDSLVTVAVAVAVVVAVAGVFTVVTTAGTGEAFTEFYLLNGTDTDGDDSALVAGSYPQRVAAGETASVVLGIENREGRGQSYTVVPRLQRVAEVDDETRVLDYEEFDRTRVTVGAGRVERLDYAVEPTMTGENLRLSFLLYRGAPPDQVRTTNAYRRTHVWLNVTDTDG